MDTQVCCGRAAAFGCESEQYPISTRIDEQVVLASVRNTPEDTIIVADGLQTAALAAMLLVDSGEIPQAQPKVSKQTAKYQDKPNNGRVPKGVRSDINLRFFGDARAAFCDPLVDARKHLGLWPQAPPVMRVAVSLHLYQ
jgi:hypothetical protein